MEHLSQRGRANIERVMARIPKAILAGTKKTESTNSLDDCIDLSMAENWLIRSEVLAICKAAIDNNFDTHVSDSRVLPESEQECPPGLTCLAPFVAHRLLG